MEKMIIGSTVSVIAGIVLFIVILINNTDRGTKKPANEWWIPSSGFLLAYAVFLPIFICLDASKYPTETMVIKWSLLVILGISLISWIIGKIIRRRRGKL